MLSRYRVKSFGQLLIALVLVTLFQPFLSAHRLLSVLTVFVLLDGIYVSTPDEVRKGFRRAVTVLWLIVLAFVVVGVVSGAGILRDSADVMRGIMQTALFALCLAATLRHVLRERDVNLELLFAAVVGYFFIVATFAAVYHVAAIFDPSAFQYQPWVHNLSEVDPQSQLTYFSFVTAASLGYGDILPRNPYVQMFAVIEVVVGQFYLATVIARLVSLYGNKPER